MHARSLGGRPLGGYQKDRQSRALSKRGRTAWYDPTLQFDLNFLRKAGETIGEATIRGPVLTFTRASDGLNFNESGVLVTASTDEPRYDHDPASSDAALGLLIEEARTNICLQSADFGTTWTVSSSTVTTNQEVAPDGNTAADNIDDLGGGFGQVNQSFTVSDSETYCVSIFIKKDAIVKTTRFPMLELDYTGGTRTRLNLTFDTSTAEMNAYVRDGTGTVAGHGVIDSGDYWRFWLAGTNNATGNTSLKFAYFQAVGANADLATFSAAATGAEDAWGAQVELSSKPSSHIPTTTTSVTRAAEPPPNSTDVSWLNASNGTLFIQARIPFVSAAERGLFTIDDGGTTDRLRLYMDAAENVNFETINSADTNGASDGAAVIAVDTVFKAAGTYEDDSVIGYVDGTGSTEDTTAGIPVTDAATTVRVGGDSAGTHLNGHLQIAQFYNVTKPAGFGTAITT